MTEKRKSTVTTEKVTTMRLDEWDKEIAPVLWRIEMAAKRVERELHHINNFCRELIRHIEALPKRPEWVTEASAAVDDALKTATVVHKNLENALKAYQDKPATIK